MKGLLYSFLFAVFGLTLWFLSSAYKWEIYYYKQRILNGDTILINNKEIKLPSGYAKEKTKINRPYHMLYSSALGNNFRLIVEEKRHAKF